MIRVAIIPARGGSKGIPRKNLRKIAGKPLVAWTIETAKRSTMIDKVFVSTDDDEIATVSKRYGADVVMRPKEISGDEASSESAILHAVETIKSQGIYPDEIVFLQCTSPLTETRDIDDCIRKLEDEDADSAFTAKEFFYFLWRINHDGNAEGINHDKKIRERRQDREPQYEENGSVYVFRTDGFVKSGHRFFGKTVISVMPEERCHEIDVEDDLEYADYVMRKRHPQDIIGDKNSLTCPGKFDVAS